MRKRVLITLAVVAMSAGSARAQEAFSMIGDAADAIGLLRGLKEVDNYIAGMYEGVGTMVVNGQTVQVPRYHAEMRYDIPGMRIDYDLGEGAQQQRRGEVVAGKYAWNEDKPGAGLVPGYGTATPAPDAYAERLLQMWMTHMGAVKAAMAAVQKAKVTTLGGRPAVSFPLPAPLQSTALTMTLDENKRPARIQARLGNRLYEAEYSNYKDFDLSDAPYPARTVFKRDGQVVLDLILTNGWGYNPYVIFPIPKNVGAGQAGRVGG